MSLLTVKRITDTTPDTISPLSSKIEFEKEFNFNNLKQLYDESTSSPPSKQEEQRLQSVQTTCLISLNLIEKYFVIKDAALILPRRKQNRSMFRSKNDLTNEFECHTSTTLMSQTVTNSTGDILTHLKAIVQLLRPCDTISVAVKLFSYHANKIRYLVIVETIARNNQELNIEDEDDYDTCCKESVILGLDLQLNGDDEQQLTCTIGLVMPIYADCEITLNGDGGFKFKTHHSTHIFKPVSIQAMWSSYQYLHKAFDNARRKNFYSISTVSMSSLIENELNNHEWVKYYTALVNKSSSSCNLNEWYQKEERTTQREDFTTPYFDGVKLSKDEEETGHRIKEKLKEIMISSKDDYGSMSSIYIRELLEKELGLKLDKFKKFIDVTIFQFYNQLVECATQLLPHLYLGTEWNASNYDTLIQENITHILNVSSEVDNFFPDTFKYLNIRVLDIDQTDLIKEFDRTNRFIQEAKDQATCCLVHCKMGVSRSASVCLAYLMKEFNWSYRDAFSFTKQKRSCINPNDGFKSQLATYESILNAHKAKYNLFEPSTSTLSLNSQLISIEPNSNSNGSTSPNSRNSFENQSLLLTPSASNESDKELLTKISVKETINKLKSISSSEQLPTKLINSPPMSPQQKSKNGLFTTTTSLVLSPIKRTTSHLTTQNELRKKITETTVKDDLIDENIFRTHHRSKSSSDKNDFNKLNRQSWASDTKQFKLKQISNLNNYSSESCLNSDSKQMHNSASSSSSSSSSIRSAVRNSLTFNLNEDSIYSTAGNVKRQVESINFKSRPCTPQNDSSEDVFQLNINKRQSILSLGESIAEVDDDFIAQKLLENIAEKVVPFVDCSLVVDETVKQINTTSPDGKRFKFELTHQFQPAVLRPKKVFEFLAEKKNEQISESTILSEKETTLT